MPPNPPFKTASAAVELADDAKSSSSPALEYVELHCISNFTFLRGASFPEELVEQAHDLGYQALAITDECSLSGVVRAHMAAKERKLKLIIGSEFFLSHAEGVSCSSQQSEALSNQDCHLVVLAKSRCGYGQLSHLITCARREAVKGEYIVNRQMLEANLPRDCIVLWLPNLRQQPEYIACQAVWLSRLFQQQLWIGVQLLLRGDDRAKLQQLQKLGEQFSIPLCAAGGVYMHHPERRILQDTITAIRLGRKLCELGLEAESNGQRHLRSVDQLSKLYPSHLLDATVQISQQCDFVLDELRYE